MVIGKSNRGRETVVIERSHLGGRSKKPTFEDANWMDLTRLKVSYRSSKYGEYKRLRQGPEVKNL